MAYIGVHFPNGPADPGICNGMGAVTLLHLQADALPSLEPAVKLVRYYSPNILAESPEAVARYLSQFQHVVPFNEADLHYETGQPQDGFNLDATLGHVRNWWYQFAKYHRQYGGGTLHFPAWSALLGTDGPIWPEADVLDFHCYLPTASAILEAVDAFCARTTKPVMLSEWNMGRPWADVDPAEVRALLDGLAQRPQVLAATAFIYRWDNPDPTMPNYNLEDTAALEAMRGFVAREISTSVESPAASSTFEPETIISEASVSRTERQQTLIDVTNGWATRMGWSKPLTKREQKQAALELAGVREGLEQEWPVDPQ